MPSLSLASEQGTKLSQIQHRYICHPCLYCGELSGYWSSDDLQAAQFRGWLASIKETAPKVQDPHYRQHFSGYRSVVLYSPLSLSLNIITTMIAESVVIAVHDKVKDIINKVGIQQPIQFLHDSVIPHSQSNTKHC